MKYDEETIADIRRCLEEAEAEVYTALTVAQEEPGDATLENRLDAVHANLLDILDKLE